MTGWWQGYGEFLTRTRRWWLLAWAAIMVWAFIVALSGQDTGAGFTYALS